MNVSVALCTFNGARFLPDLLASLAAQLVRPAELVVCDDASTDGTAAVVRAFAAAAPFPIRLHVNPTTLGTAANFSKAFALCTGDVIAPADQDDVWLPHKLAALALALAATPAAGLAFGNAAVVDERLSPLGFTLWDAIGFGRRERTRFRRGGALAALLRRDRVTGATMAFRAAHRDVVLPIPPGWLHDAWAALAIAAVAPCLVVDEPLIRYRRHAGQQVGDRRPGFLARLREARGMDRAAHEAEAARYEAALDRLAGAAPAALRLLDAKAAHLRRRAALRAPGAWRLPAVLGEVWRGNYRRYSHGWKAAVQDLFLG